MNDMRDDIINLKTRLKLVLDNNKELRGAFDDICKRCEQQLKSNYINADCLRLAVDILKICRSGGI